MNARFCVSLAAIVVGLFIMCVYQPMALYVMGYLLVGWVMFVVNAASRVEIDWPAVAGASLTLILLVAGLHGMLCWAARQRATPSESAGSRRPWAWRWSAAIVAVVVLMFAAGTATIGLTHQAGQVVPGTSCARKIGRLNAGQPHVGQRSRERAREPGSSRHRGEVIERAAFSGVEDHPAGNGLHAKRRARSDSRAGQARGSDARRELREAEARHPERGATLDGDTPCEIVGRATSRGNNRDRLVWRKAPQEILGTAEAASRSPSAAVSARSGS